MLTARQKTSARVTPKGQREAARLGEVRDAGDGRVYRDMRRENQRRMDTQGFPLAIAGGRSLAEV